MFRTIVIIGVLAVAAFMAGWFTIHRDENETTIRFNRDEIRADTSNAIAKGRELLNQQNQQNLQNAADGQYGDQQYTDQQYYDNQYPAENQYPTYPQTQNGQTAGGNNFYPPQQAARTVPPWQNSTSGNSGTQF